MGEEDLNLLDRRKDEYGATNSLASRAGRSASIGALGGTQSLGTFSFREPPTIAGLPKSYSISADGSPSYLTPTQMGRQELYQQVPFQAVFGLQRKERTVSQAFAEYAAELDVGSSFDAGASDREKSSRLSRASLMILDELEFESSVVTMSLVFAVIVAAGSQFLVGYNTGVMNAPASVVFPGHSTLTWSLAVAAFAIGGPLGAMVGGRLADSRGRRGALLLDTWTFLLGGMIQTFAPDMITIIIARFIIGFASGYSSVLVPIYLGEMAPPTLRGMLGTITQFALVTGILVADLFAFPFSTLTRWRFLFAVTPVIAFIQLLLAPFLLESPRWLLGRDPNSLKARYIIKRLRGLRYDHEVETEVGHFVMGSSAQSSQTSRSQSDLLKEMWSNSNTRLLLVSSLVLQMSQQFSGINAVFYYSTSFFEGIIDNPLVGTTMVGAVNVAATYVALLMMDRCGRKTLLLWSSGGMFVSCIAIVMSLLGYFDNILALVAVNVYVVFFEIGLGPIPWLVVAEMFAGPYVAAAMGLSSQVNWACNFIIGLAFPYMNEYLGPYSFGPFAIVLLGVFIFSATVLPETQGSSPEELANIRKSLSQTVVYEPNADTSSAQIDLEWRKAMEQLQQEEEAERQAGTYDYGFEPIKQ